MAKTPTTAPAEGATDPKTEGAPSVQAHKVHGPLRIVCRRPGFRRAGIAHPAEATYQADHFSLSDLGWLKSEPMLDVVEL